MKRLKYGNRKVVIDGIVFDSKKESLRYCELRILEKAGQINNLRWQIPFILAPAVVIGGRKKPPLRYVCDFVYLANGQWVVEDVKSAATRKNQVYRVKKHLMKSVHNIEIVEV